MMIHIDPKSCFRLIHNVKNIITYVQLSIRETRLEKRSLDDDSLESFRKNLLDASDQLNAFSDYVSVLRKHHGLLREQNDNLVELQIQTELILGLQSCKIYQVRHLEYLEKCQTILLLQEIEYEFGLILSNKNFTRSDFEDITKTKLQNQIDDDEHPNAKYITQFGGCFKRIVEHMTALETLFKTENLHVSTQMAYQFATD